MTRDMEFIRTILKRLDETGPNTEVSLRDFPNHTEDQYNYHMDLLYQAKYVNAARIASFGSTQFRMPRLTWEGHELLDNLQDDTVWNKTKQSLGEKVNSVSIAIVQEVAKGVIRSMLGLH